MVIYDDTVEHHRKSFEIVAFGQTSRTPPRGSGVACGRNELHENIISEFL